ncbi:MAG: ABC transporter ATP-binding protein [Bdellovibrio sp.]|nr:ABC transporter ATP-binding protein [Bdellovibrio sp.]
MNHILRLRPYIRPYLRLIVASTLLAIPLSALRASPVALVKYIGDNLFVSKDHQKLLLLPLLFIAIYLLNFVVRFFHFYLLRIVVARVNQKIKNDLFEHLMGLSADHFTKQSVGTLISRVGNDPQYIDTGLSCLNTIIREPITFLVLLISAFYLNWKLTLLIGFIIPFLALVFSATGRNLKRYIQNMSEETAKLYSTLQESFTGIRIINAFGLEKYMRKKFREKSENYTQFLLKTAMLEEAAHPMVELIAAFAIAGVVYYGGREVVYGRMTSSELLAFFTAFFLMVNPLRMLNDVNIKLNTVSAACKRIFEVFDWRSNLQEASEPLHTSAFTKEICFKNVCFAYPDMPEKNVLNNINLKITKGKKVDIICESGAGKSSLVHLIPRIFDVTGGSIFFDGCDIRNFSLDGLRKLIAVVSQDVFLFNDTISENIRCGRFSATTEEIKDAAKKAHALDFIESLSQSFDTVIGDRGQKLSGGERQRIAIARAFLRNAPILILDEATSNLDSASEREVQNAIEALMEDKTTLIIAHRLSTIKNVDHIFVLSDGEIIEAGNHDELLKNHGEYARFYYV